VPTFVLVIVITALSWPFHGIGASATLDGSWVLGLSLARVYGLAFGTHIIFTYGPLGFTAAPVAVSRGVLFWGEAIGGLVQMGLVAVLLINLRCRMNWLAASVITLLAASLVGSVKAEPLTAIAFGLVALALTSQPRDVGRAMRMLAVAGGTLAGFAILVKIDDGLAVGALVAVGLLGGRSRPRELAVGATSLFVTLVALWLALGQPLGALPDYLRNGYEVVSGYVDAMGINAIGASGQWQVILLVVSGIVMAVGAWRAMWDRPLRRRMALSAAVLLVVYFLSREIFIRYDPGHVAIVALLAAVALMIPWAPSQRGLGLAMAGMLAIASLSALAEPIGDLLDPIGDVNQLVAQAGDVFHPWPLITQEREALRGPEGVPPNVVAALAGHCVDAEPTEVAAVWANPSLRWCPLPVMQSYDAYTPRLDRLDAAAYADARQGPNGVLRELNAAIDGRNAIWESPLAMLSLLCHFRELASGGVWQALGRVPNRCGPPRSVAVIHGSLGKTIVVPNPPPGAVLIAAIDGLQVGGFERLETLFTRADPRFVTVNGSTFHIPPGLANDGLILDVPASADYAAPFNLNLGARTLVVTIEGHAAGAITIRLLAVPIH
jgi:hypothetical protein